MSREATKTRLVGDLDAFLMGRGLDIGCGDDPVAPNAERFDREHGDANHIRRFLSGEYDYVFACHALEHMDDPLRAASDWFSLVKPGGHLIVIVPDEDLYEQGSFPSLFNSDHKHTFTISKASSWSPRSVNVLDLARSLGGEIVRLRLQNHGYDYRILRHSPGRSRRRLHAQVRRLAARRSAGVRVMLTRLASLLGVPVDQTAFLDTRLAQIELVLRRTPGCPEPTFPA